MRSRIMQANQLLHRFDTAETRRRPVGRVVHVMILGGKTDRIHEGIRVLPRNHR
jgi:hypothetical protein